MNLRTAGQLRRSQVITTYGPGALIDLPKHSAIVGGLDTWPATSKLDQIVEPRLTRKLQIMTGVPSPALFAPPPDTDTLGKTKPGIGAWRFPEWVVVHEPIASGGRERSRRLVHRKALDERGRFDGRQVVATRFVRACPRGHVDDLDWRRFVHGADDSCPKTRQLWLDERGTTGDLANLYVRCECGKSRNLYEATLPDHPLGACRGARPWLGRHAGEDCHLPSRLPHQDRIQRLVSPGGQRTVDSRSRDGGGDGRRRAVAGAAVRRRARASRLRHEKPGRGRAARALQPRRRPHGDSIQDRRRRPGRAPGETSGTRGAHRRTGGLRRRHTGRSRLPRTAAAR